MRKQKKKHTVLKVILLIVLILLLVATGGAFWVYQKFSDTVGEMNYRELESDKLEINQQVKENKALKGYTNIALFGLDSREGNLEQANSDTIIIASINNDTKEIKMVSVYRDTYLNIGNDMYRKANAAYAYGGPEQAVTMLNRNLDIDIDNYVAFDFKAVAQAIDILGGVDIDVESEEERKYLNDYVSYTSQYVGGSDEEVEHTGLQTLNGVQAVSYARIRYTAGDDYKRAERQRRVLTEMIKKAKSASLPELNSLINTVFPQISTDLDKKDIISMATVMIKYDMANSGGFPYSKDTFTPSKSIGSVVAPCDLESNVIELHKRLYGTDNYTPSETVKKYSEHIVDVSGYTAEWKADNRFSGQDEFFGNGTQTTDDGSGSTEDTTE